MNSFEQLVRERRTVQDFLPESVDWKVVERCLALSLWVPNHKITFPWLFKRLGKVAREEIAAQHLLATKKKLGDSWTADMARAIRSKFVDPAEILLLGIKKSNPAQEKEDFATLAASVTVLSLALWQEGVGVKWATGSYSRHPNVLESAQFNQQTHSPEGVLIIGRAARVPLPVARPELANFLSFSP